MDKQEKKFIIDLGSVELTDMQIEEINKGIEELVSKVLIQNAATNNVKLKPLSSDGDGYTTNNDNVRAAFHFPQPWPIGLILK